MSTRKAGVKRPRPISVHSVASVVTEPFENRNTEGENAYNIVTPVKHRSDVYFQEVYDMLMEKSETIPFAERLQKAYDIATRFTNGQMEQGYNEHTAAGLYEGIATDLSIEGHRKAAQKVQRLANKSMREARAYGIYYGGGRRKAVNLTRHRRARRTQKLTKQRRFCGCNRRQ